MCGISRYTCHRICPTFVGPSQDVYTQATEYVPNIPRYTCHTICSTFVPYSTFIGTLATPYIQHLYFALGFVSRYIPHWSFLGTPATGYVQFVGMQVTWYYMWCHLFFNSSLWFCMSPSFFPTPPHSKKFAIWHCSCITAKTTQLNSQGGYSSFRVAVYYKWRAIKHFTIHHPPSLFHQAPQRGKEHLSAALFFLW